MAKDENVAEAIEQKQPEAEPSAEPKSDEAAEPEKKYTDGDVDEIVKKRLARERADWEKQLEQARKQEREAATEAEKLKGMNDLEREQHEREKLEQENAALLQQINMQQQMEVARESLAEAGIHWPNAMLKMFVSPDASQTKESIDAVKQMWASEVDKAVKEALKSTPPKSPNPSAAKKPSAGKSFAEEYNKQMKGDN